MADPFADLEGHPGQVIVFTHDVVFLLRLKEIAELESVEQRHQYVQQFAGRAGVCAPELPWVALKIKSRIGYLRKLLQDARTLYRDGQQTAYETDARQIYGYLREAWERGLEEVLLNGVVERFRPGVQTRQVGVIADITAEDCRAVEFAMTTCSRWLRGHDQAPAARADIPEPESLKAEIDALDSWVHKIRSRRH